MTAGEDQVRRTGWTKPPSDPRQWVRWARSIDGGSVLLLRTFLGGTFVFAGLQKLTNRGFFDAGNPSSIQSQLRGSASTTPFGSLISPLLHVAVPLGIVIAFAEIAVGIGTLLGLFSRLAAAGGMVINLMFFLTVSYNASPYYNGSDIVFFFAWSVLAFGGAGALSLDGYFEAQRAREAAEAAAGSGRSKAGAGRVAAVDRRIAIAKVGSAGLIGVVALFFGSISALVGRVLTKDPTRPTSGSGGTSGTSTTPTTVGPTTAGGKPVGGKVVLSAKEVPVGGGKLFTDPFNQEPCYALQPKPGEYAAFSAICTHLGCTVAYVQSVDQFQCPCHGSIYSASTGAVLGGPAPSPLPRIAVVEAAGDLYETK